MMKIDYETPRYALFYSAECGIGFIRRKRDVTDTPLITGSDITVLRRMLNRAKTNATSKTSKRRPYLTFAEIADVLLSEYFTR